MKLRGLHAHSYSLEHSVPRASVRAIAILGVLVDRGGLSEAMERIHALLDPSTSTRVGTGQVITLNPEYLMRARRDATLRHIIADAGVRVADGVGLIVAARLLHGANHGVARVTGNDLVAALAAAGVPLFLLGAAPGVAEDAAAVLLRRHPQARIAGVWAGDAGPGDDAETRRRINASDARVVLVAYGMPRQDYWIARNLPHLDAPVAIGVGGAFDYLAGRVPRAPAWMRARGLEWFYRLIRQPWRWRRILVVWQFAVLVVLIAARQRVQSFLSTRLIRFTGGR